MRILASTSIRFEYLQKGDVTVNVDETKSKTYKIYQTTHESRAFAIQNSLVQPHDHKNEITGGDLTANLVSYEGIITNDKASTSGIYILDKEIELMLSPLCLVSNIQLFRRGQKLNVTHAHLANLYYIKFLICEKCSLSNNSNISGMRAVLVV